MKLQPLSARPELEFWVKDLLATLLSFAAFALAIPLSLVLNLAGFGYDSNYWVSRLCTVVVGTVLGLSFDLEGLENVDRERPCVVMVNHQSGIDAVAVQGAFQPRRCVILAKKELMYYPFLNLYIWLGHNFLIDRKDHEKALHTMKSIATEMAEKNVSLCIYPEGTRSNFTEPNLLKFKKGAFHIAINGQYPIVPVVVQNYSHVYSAKLKRAPGGTIKIKVLSPIQTTGLTARDTDKLVEKTRSLMLTTLQEMSTVKDGESLADGRLKEE